MAFRVPVTVTFTGPNGGPAETITFPAQIGAEGCMVDVESHGLEITPLENQRAGVTRIYPWHRILEVSYAPLR